MKKNELINALSCYDDDTEIYFSKASDTDLVEITDVIPGEKIPGEKESHGESKYLAVIINSLF